MINEGEIVPTLGGLDLGELLFSLLFEFLFLLLFMCVVDVFAGRAPSEPFLYKVCAIVEPLLQNILEHTW